MVRLPKGYRKFHKRALAIPGYFYSFLRDPASSGRGNLVFCLYPCLLTAFGYGGIRLPRSFAPRNKYRSTWIAASFRSSQQVLGLPASNGMPIIFVRSQDPT
jgi:hypothetical protein